MPDQRRKERMMSLPEIEWGKAAAQAPHWAVLEETFAKTPQEAQEKLDSLVQADPQQHEGMNYSIYSAVRLLENAFELGHEMCAGYVMTEQNWQSIVEKNNL